MTHVGRKVTVKYHFGSFYFDKGDLEPTQEERDLVGLTPLHQAATQGNIEMIRSLVKRKADVNMEDSNGLNPLFIAVKEDSPESIWALVGLGISPQCENSQGEFPLYYAAFVRSFSAAQALVDSKADVDQALPDSIQDAGFTALIKAADRGDTATVRLLLAAGAGVNKVEGGGGER